MDLLNAYPSTVTANASGINNPLSPTTRVVTGTGSQNQAGQNVLAVASTSGFFVGETITVFQGSVGGNGNNCKISSIRSGSPGTFTCTSNLTLSFVAPDLVILRCSGCTTESGWTITSPIIYYQYEQDLKQLFTWYGNYTNWIGFGEGATGDRNEYIDPGTALKTARPWDNGTMLAFADSLFFQRTVNSAGYYTNTNMISKIWSMFLADRPDIDVSTSTHSYPRIRFPSMRERFWRIHNHGKILCSIW